MRTSFTLLVVASCLFIVPEAGAQQANLLDVGTRSQLLADPDLVYESRNVSFTLHPARKHPQNPLMRADRPWEGPYVTAFGSTVRYDDEERLFKMWYGAPGDPAWFDSLGAFYATSRDGIAWDKPEIGPRPAKNGRPHNSVAAVDLPSVFFDPRDPDADRRYKMVAYLPDRGYLAFISRDGLHWQEQDPRPIVPISYVDDVVSAIFDHRTGEYVAFPKLQTPVFGRVRRSIYVTRSHDFRHWSAPAPAFLSDRRDDLGSLARIERARPLLKLPTNFHVMRTEFYGAGAYVAESCVVGLPWVFTLHANIPKFGNQEGVVDIQLAISRDLESWRRPFRTPILPLGKAGEWDSGMVFSTSQAIDVGDEVWLYYGGSKLAHQEAEAGDKEIGSIGLATWRRDRFVSADGAAEPGVLTTVPLRFAGDRLEINAETQKDGEILVELLTADGQPLAGFPRSTPLAGDNLRHEVVFPKAPPLASMAGKPVSLRFHLRKAQLYAFAFR